MTIHDYMQSKEIGYNNPSFAALIMAAIRKADSTNIEKLKIAFPEIYDELQKRYNAPGGGLNQQEIDWVVERSR